LVGFKELKTLEILAQIILYVNCFDILEFAFFCHFDFDTEDSGFKKNPLIKLTVNNIL